CVFAPLQGFLPKVLLDTSQCELPLLGTWCRSAHPFRRNPLPPEIPLPGLRCRVQGFSPSSRVAPPSASRVYFTPQPPFGFPLQGVPLSESCDNSSLPRCRLAVAPKLRSRLLEWRDLRRTEPPSLGGGAGAFGRLHGVAPSESPFCRQVIFH